MTKGEWEGGLKAKAGEGREGEGKRTEGEKRKCKRTILNMALRIEAELEFVGEVCRREDEEEDESVGK